jgi:hypothetical protein
MDRGVVANAMEPAGGLCVEGSVLGAERFTAYFDLSNGPGNPTMKHRLEGSFLGAENQACSRIVREIPQGIHGTNLLCAGHELKHRLRERLNLLDVDPDAWTKSANCCHCQVATMADASHAALRPEHSTVRQSG